MRVGPVMAELYGLAQDNPALHGLLVAFVSRIPVRPPYVPGLRRLFKYAEMIDDASMFAAVARRFETAAPMYRREWRNRLGEGLSAACPKSTSTSLSCSPTCRAPLDASTALSETTVHYFKRRIWRALRKRGELGAGSFLEMATAYLLAFTGTDARRSRAASAITAGKTGAASPTRSITDRSLMSGAPGTSSIVIPPTSACGLAT